MRMADLSRRTALSGGVALLAVTCASSSGQAEGGGVERAPTLAVAANLDRLVGPNTRLWCATGLSPAELLLTPELQQALTFLGAVPNGGISFIRIHYLLDLVAAVRTGTGIVYDWSLLDEALDGLVHRGLRPLFELMGNPSGLYDDFGDLDQVKAWRDLVAELAARCIGRFGRYEVAAWLFETWNEPDLPFWRWGERGLANYYDACRAGLDAVDPVLRLGGPCTARTLSSMFKAFLAHCDTGTNILTEATGARLDFISVHEKGVRESEEDLTPRPLRMIARELQAIDYVRQHHPRFAALPFMNDEADPQLGWDTPHTWRARPTYAAMIAKIADQHRRLIAEERVVDSRLVNDNGFLGPWGHRTLLTYFGPRRFPSGQEAHQTDVTALRTIRPPAQPFELVKKPALAVMELMALLGPELCSVSSDPPLDPDRDGLGLIATAWPKLDEGPSRAAVLVYGSPEPIWASGTRRLALSLDALAPGDYAAAAFRLDDQHGCAFDLWDEWEGPDRLDAAQFAALRAAQEAELLAPVQRVRIAAGRSLLQELALPLPSVTLFLVERWSNVPPSAPTQLAATRQPSLTEQTNVLLTWRPGSAEGVQLFDVLFGQSEEGPFARVNPAPLLSAAYLHARPPGAGIYVVEARRLDGAVSRSSRVPF
jgi:L-iduronidase